MKNYRITVNGNTYDVLVEELAPSAVNVQTAAPSIPVAPIQQAASPSPSVQPAPAAPVAQPTQTAPATPVATGGTPVTAPMPGTLLDIKVNVGDKVEANQVVAVLEAMKMENDIVTPISGTVTAVNATKGQGVNSGDALITVAE